MGRLRTCVTSAQTDVHCKFPSTLINNYMALNILQIRTVSNVLKYLELKICVK
jgi:hypothetical protein